MKLVANVQGVIRTAEPATAARYCAAIVAELPSILRTRSLSPADQRLLEGSLRFAVDGARIELDGDHFAGARELYCRRVYFACPQVQLRPESTVVDLGANAGLFTLMAAKRACRVLAVEAQAGFVADIERNLQRNACRDNVQVATCLVGAGTGIFATPDAVCRGSHHVAGTAVPSVPMAELLSSHGIEHIDFLKVDIEGSEFALFREPEPWMKRVSCIAMEVHPDFGDPAALQAVLSQVGLQSELRNNAGHTCARVSEDSGYLFAWRN